MATRRFADLSSYRRAVDNAQGTANLIDSVLGGIQQGVALQRLPQTLQQQDLANQLQAAINQQKLIDLQNPEAALARQVERELAVKGALNPDLGLLTAQRGLGTIATPGAITPQQQAALPTTLTPETVLPTAAAGLPVTEVAPFGIGTGVYSDPSVPIAAAQRARDAELAKIREEASIKNELESQRVQSFAPGTTVGTAEQVRRGEGVRIPERGVEPKPFSLSPGEKLFAPDGTILAENPANSTSTRPIVVPPGSAVLGADGKEIFRNPSSKDASAQAQSPYQQERQTRILSSIDELEPLVGPKTVGLASMLRGIPTTDALNFASKLDSLKASIAFGELTAMREASKTGGALGQVSNIELNLLENALGALNQAQTPKQFLAELGKIKASIKRWQEAASKSGAPQGSNAPSTINIRSIKRVN